MADFSDSTPLPEIHRRSFLGGTAAALAAIAIPAAAVAAGTPSEPDWEALGAELEARYREQLQASAKRTEAWVAARENYPPRPFLPIIKVEEDGSWIWDPQALSRMRDDDHLTPEEFARRAEERFQRRLQSAPGLALSHDWPPGAAERFQEAGARLWPDIQRQIQEWQAQCDSVDQQHGLAELDSAIDAADARIDEFEAHILALPATSLAAVGVKLDLILRYSDNDNWTTSLTKDLRAEVTAATEMHRLA